MAQKGGVGIQIENADASGLVRIIGLKPGGPAFESGSILVGDVLCSAAPSPAPVAARTEARPVLEAPFPCPLTSPPPPRAQVWTDRTCGDSPLSRSRAFWAAQQARRCKLRCSARVLRSAKPSGSCARAWARRRIGRGRHPTTPPGAAARSSAGGAARCGVRKTSVCRRTCSRPAAPPRWCRRSRPGRRSRALSRTASHVHPPPRRTRQNLKPPPLPRAPGAAAAPSARPGAPEAGGGGARRQ